MKWFVQKRNEVTKIQPFPLQKRININYYFPCKDTFSIQQILTVDNEETFASVVKTSLDLVKEIDSVDKFFSIEIQFQEQNISKDIFPMMLEGIDVLYEIVLKPTLRKYPCSCSKCKTLMGRIEELRVSIPTKQILFHWDGDIIEGKEYFANNIMFYGEKEGKIQDFYKNKQNLAYSLFDPKNSGEVFQVFEYFISMHISCYREQKNSLMPVFFIVFTDNTFSILPYVSELKSTTYRLVANIADQILEKPIKAVFHICENYIYDLDQKIWEIPYFSRIKQARREGLWAIMVTDALTIAKVSFDSVRIHDDTYVREIMKEITETKITNSIHHFLWPLEQAFRKRIQKI